MKGLLKSSMFVAALLAGTSAYAATFTVDGINYEPLTETTCKVATTVVESGTYDVVIPQTVTNGGVTYTVTELGQKAFDGNSTPNNFISSIKLPDTIEKIGAEAVKSIPSLNEFTIPVSCKVVDMSAFFNSKIVTMTILGALETIGVQSFASMQVTSLVFPEGLTTVGDFAFGNNSKLTEIEFPSTVKKFGWGSFSGCNAIKKFVCKAVTPPSVDIQLFTGATKATLYVPKGSKDAYAAATGWKAFPTIEEIEEEPETPTVTVGDTFTVDGINYEVTSETTCKVIETLVADGTTAVVVPQTVECNTVSLTVTEIGDKAFKGTDYNTNSKIKSFTLPETIEKIGKEAFAQTLGNTGEFVIPAACTEIGASAFYNTRFTTLTILGPVKTVGENAFNCASCTSIVFPEGLETVGDYAFQNNNNLIEVDFPSTLSSIDFIPFYGSSNLAKVTCRATTPPTVQMFYGVSKTTLYVPEASVGAYKADSNWKQFKAIEPIKEVGVEAVDAEGVKVVAKGGVINVAGAEGDVEVYNAAGQLLYKGADEAISVPAKGITIVKVGGKAVKVAL